MSFENVSNYIKDKVENFKEKNDAKKHCKALIDEYSSVTATANDTIIDRDSYNNKTGVTHSNGSFEISALEKNGVRSITIRGLVPTGNEQYPTAIMDITKTIDKDGISFSGVYCDEPNNLKEAKTIDIGSSQIEEAHTNGNEQSAKELDEEFFIANNLFKYYEFEQIPKIVKDPSFLPDGFNVANEADIKM